MGKTLPFDQLLNNIHATAKNSKQKVKVSGDAAFLDLVGGAPVESKGDQKPFSKPGK